MKIEITCGSVANAHGVAMRGDVVDWPENDARPLVEGGMAKPASDEPKPKKKA